MTEELKPNEIATDDDIFYLTNAVMSELLKDERAKRTSLMSRFLNRHYSDNKELKALRQQIKDYEDVLSDKRRLTRELDVAMHGEEGAAQQASLCDLIGPVKALRQRVARLEEELAAKREFGELIEALKALGPFELVQGDVIKRTQPHSGQVVNTNGAWAVSNGNDRGAHRVRKHIQTINTYIEVQKPEALEDKQ